MQQGSQVHDPGTPMVVVRHGRCAADEQWGSGNMRHRCVPWRVPHLQIFSTPSNVMALMRFAVALNRMGRSPRPTPPLQPP